jgi:hypothetical protein
VGWGGSFPIEKIRVSFFFYFMHVCSLTLPTARPLSFSTPDLVAKTNADGDIRYFAIYSSTTSQRMTFYYTPLGSTRTEAATFTGITIGDGEVHELLFTVANSVATLYVDENARGTFALSGNGLADCGVPGPDCYLNVGQRRSPSGGALRLRGTVFEAVIYPLFAQAPPS